MRPASHAVMQALHAEWTKLRTLPGTPLAAGSPSSRLTVAVSAAAAAAVELPVRGLRRRPDQAQPHRDLPRPGGRRHPGRAGDQRRVQHRHDPHHPDGDAAPGHRAGRQGAIVTGLVLAAGTIAVLGSLLAGRLILPGHGFTPAHGYPPLSLARRAGAARRRRLGPLPRPDRPAQPRHRHRRPGLRRRPSGSSSACSTSSRSSPPSCDNPHWHRHRADRADDRRARHPGHHRPAQPAHQPLGGPWRARRLGRGRAAGRRRCAAPARRVSEQVNQDKERTGEVS